jgi:hypothetical protein
VAAETAAMATRLAMTELASVSAEVEAAVTVDAAHATEAELEALRGSSTSSSVSTDDGTNDELKRAREPAREQAAQWVAVHPQVRGGGIPSGADALVTLRAGAHTAAAAQTGADASVTGSTEIVAFTGGAALPP